MMPAYKTYYEERAKALDSIIEKFRSVQSSNVVDTDKLIRIEIEEELYPESPIGSLSSFDHGRSFFGLLEQRSVPETTTV